MRPAGEVDEFRNGWPVVLAAMLGIGLGLSPVPFYTIGILAPEFAKNFGWRFGDIFFGITVTTIAVVLCSPAVGFLVDRFGVRRVALTSVVLFSFAYMALALSNGSLLLFYATWALIASLGSGTLPITWTRAVNNRFDVGKGLALGLSLMGSGIFGYFIKPFVAWMIAVHGWRMAIVAIGALPLLIALPVALLAFHDTGPVHQNAAERRAALAARKAATPGLGLRETFAGWRFWVIAMSYMPVAFAVGGPIPNLENILKLYHFTTADIVTLASFIGLSVVIGRVLGGWLIDRFWAPGVSVFLFGVPAAACWVLAQGPLGYHATAFCICCIGFAAGLEFDLLAYLVARYFGMKHYGLIYGALYSSFAIGAGLAPFIFGRMYDASKTYTLALEISAVLMFGGALLLLTLGRYQRFDENTP